MEGAEGFFWTGSFWVGSSGILRADEGREVQAAGPSSGTRGCSAKKGTENHDAGFLNYYSSVFACAQTKDPKYREGGLRAAARLKEHFNPIVEARRVLGGGGDDTIIDTMMNLQIWWWASKATGRSAVARDGA